MLRWRLRRRHNAAYVTHIRGISSSLNERLQQQAPDEERGPFDLQFVTCVPGIENVLANQSPKVVLASTAGLETSYAQLLLKKWCAKIENLVLFVTTPPPGTLAANILTNPTQTRFGFTVRSREDV